jgi:hypothetical protein
MFLCVSKDKAVATPRASSDSAPFDEVLTKIDAHLDTSRQPGQTSKAKGGRITL